MPSKNTNINANTKKHDAMDYDRNYDRVYENSLYPSFCFKYKRYSEIGAEKISTEKEDEREDETGSEIGFKAVCEAGCEGLHHARLGELSTPHGKIQTPAFIFCGTKGTIKGLHINQVYKENTQIILANTYHMMLQPNEDIVYKNGGLHKFTGWNGPMMTDSGGFQIFSLSHGGVSSEIKGKRNSAMNSINNQNKNKLVKIRKDGAEFKSYINGQKYFLTPEKSMEIQSKLGADLCFAFDECTPFHVKKEYTKKSMLLSHEWEQKSLDHFTILQQEKISKNEINQSLYGIVQGGVYEDLRSQSVDFIASRNFFGNAIGGSLGKNASQMDEIVKLVSDMLYDKSPDKPIHLLGIGRIRDIFQGVLCGIDTFDCVHPTRIARHGGAIVKGAKYIRERDVGDGDVGEKIIEKSCVGEKVIENSDVEEKGASKCKNNAESKDQFNEKSKEYGREHINLYNNCYKEDTSPIDSTCNCETCKVYSRSYIHHLLKAKEMLGHVAITIHNIHTMNRLMEEIRAALSECIESGKEEPFFELMNEWI